MNSSGRVSTNRLAIVGTAIVCVLIILASLLPVQVNISTDGMLSIGLRQASANPGIGEYAYKKQLTFNTTGISVTSNQTNFPICVHINTSSWPTQSERDAFFDTNTNGKRVTFYDSDESTILDYEVEYFSNVQGSEEAIYWVETPQVDGSSTTDHIHVGYGNDPFGSAQDDKAGTWASSYKFVHHMADWNVEAYKSQVYQAPVGLDYFVMEPMVIYREGETHPYKMWLHGKLTDKRIYHLYSDDGSAWTYVGLASPNSYYIEPFVMWNPEGDNKYWMYAASALGGPFALLTSSSETGFTADTASVIAKSSDNTKFDETGIYNPALWYEDPDSTANLSTSMDNSTTECDVSDTTKFAATQYIKIESEWMLVTAIVNATHCHVTRARLGTTAVAHTQPQDVYKRQWYMAYDGTGTPNGGAVRVGLALSYDGRTWTKQYNGSGAGGSWSLPGERHSDAGTIYKVDGVYYHCGHGNWINNADAGTDIQGWSYSTDLASWTALGGTGYEAFISRTKTWEGVGHTDSQTADLCGLVDNNANPVTVGGYSYFYYTGVMQQAPDSGHPMSTGLVKLPGTFSQCVIERGATLADSTGNNNPDLRLWLTPTTGQVGNGKNFYTGSIASDLRFPDSASHDLSTTFTFAASVYLDAYLAGPEIIFNKDLATTGNRQFVAMLDRLEDNTKIINFYYWDTSNNLIAWYTDAAQDMTTGWHRIVWVRESAARKIYVDGTAVATTNYGTLAAMKQTSQPLEIGYRAADGRTMDGNLDELLIQDAVWTADWAKLDYYNVKKTNFNGDSWLSWGSQEAAPAPAITNSPDNYGFGILQVNTTGNTAINYFTLNNTGNCVVDITIQGTDLTGGDDTWTLSGTATPDENIYGLYAGLDDDDDNFDIVVNATANAFVGDLPEATTQAWGLRLCMPTSLSGYDAQQMAGNITLIASASGGGGGGGGGGAPPPATYSLTMASDPEAGGTATDLTDTSPYTADTVVSIEAVANSGYQFINWTAPAGSFTNANSAATTFTMPSQDVIVTANFAPVYNLTMAVAPGGSGTATDLTNASPYIADTVVNITASPNSDYVFVNWSAPAGTFGSATTATTTFTMPSQNVTATANFGSVYKKPTAYSDPNSVWNTEANAYDSTYNDQTTYTNSVAGGISFTARTETYARGSSLTTPFSFTINKATGTVDGDIMFMFLAIYVATPPTVDSIPSSWTLVATNTVGNNRWYLYYKIASSEGTSYTWSLTASCRYYALNVAYSSGDFDVQSISDITAISNTLYGTAGTVVRAASMSVPAANSPLVYFGAVYSTAAKTFTKPSIPTSDWVEDADEGHTTPDLWLTSGSMIWSGSGATGNMDITCSDTITTVKHAFAVALKPSGDPWVTFSNWQTKEGAYSATTLYVNWKTNGTFSNDKFAIQYTKNGGTNWYDLVASAVHNDVTIQTSSVALDANQDLTQVQVKLTYTKVTGPDSGIVYVYDIWTKGIA